MLRSGMDPAGAPRFIPFFATESHAMSFMIYLAGALIFIGGLAYGAVLLNVSEGWIVAGVITLVGLAVLTGVRATRQKDAAE